MNRLLQVLRAGLPVLALVATSCHAAPAPAPAAKATPAAIAPAKATPHAHVPADRSPVASPVVLVHKSPTCGCCGQWVEHLRKAGFTVQVDDTGDLAAIKERVGVPAAKGSCHTAEVAGYFVEGHVPADDIRRLLKEKPAARGLTAPGMPMGSPGMEMPGGGTPKYVVELVRKDGSTEVFAGHGGDAVHDHAH
ncbi:MAG: DUF411 domain-containing protein [Arenimonas sp.]